MAALLIKYALPVTLTNTSCFTPMAPAERTTHIQLSQLTQNDRPGSSPPKTYLVFGVMVYDILSIYNCINKGLKCWRIACVL